MIQIEFTRRFSMAHRLWSDPASKCATPHGHNEFVRLVLGTPAAADWGRSNMSHSFDALKSLWHGFIDKSLDHAFQLNAADPLLGYFQAHEPERLRHIVVVDGDPTTEALVIALTAKARALLATCAPEVKVLSLSIEETPTNTVSLSAETFDAIRWSAGAWCHRADYSLNDLCPADAWPALPRPTPGVCS
jgi:6-pyruvoyltetrahydropterin/6-carboxytetrahydropterin synthase